MRAFPYQISSEPHHLFYSECKRNKIVMAARTKLVQLESMVVKLQSVLLQTKNNSITHRIISHSWNHSEQDPVDVTTQKNTYWAAPNYKRVQTPFRSSQTSRTNKQKTNLKIKCRNTRNERRTVKFNCEKLQSRWKKTKT